MKRMCGGRYDVKDGSWIVVCKGGCMEGRQRQIVVRTLRVDKYCSGANARESGLSRC